MTMDSEVGHVAVLEMHFCGSKSDRRFVSEAKLEFCPLPSKTVDPEIESCLMLAEGKVAFR